MRDDTVTGTITLTFYGEGDPQVMTKPISIDFSANGLPNGGTASLLVDLTTLPLCYAFARDFALLLQFIL